MIVINKIREVFMKNKLIVFFMATLFSTLTASLATAHGKNHDKNNSDLKLYNLLLEKQNQTINEYSGFLINAIILNDKPNIFINFVDVKKNENPILKPIIFANSHSSHQVRETYNNDTEQMKNSNVEYIKLHKEPKEGHFIQFDSFDNSDHLLISEIFDKETGFCIETDTFNLQHNILSVKFYEGIKFNREQKAPNIRQMKNVFVENFLKTFGFFNPDDPTTIRRFSNYLLRTVTGIEIEDREEN